MAFEEPTYVEIEGEVLKTTDKAVLVMVDGGEQVWLPWSQIEDNGEDLKEGYTGEIYVSQWIATQKNLDYTE